MLLTAEQHRKLAQAYREPEPNWTPEVRAKALELAAGHERLAERAEQRGA